MPVSRAARCHSGPAASTFVASMMSNARPVRAEPPPSRSGAGSASWECVVVVAGPAGRGRPAAIVDGDLAQMAGQELGAGRVELLDRHRFGLVPWASPPSGLSRSLAPGSGSGWFERRDDLHRSIRSSDRDVAGWGHFVGGQSWCLRVPLSCPATGTPPAACRLAARQVLHSTDLAVTDLRTRCWRRGRLTVRAAAAITVQLGIRLATLDTHLLSAGGTVRAVDGQRLRISDVHSALSQGRSGQQHTGPDNPVDHVPPDRCFSPGRTYRTRPCTTSTSCTDTRGGPRDRAGRGPGRQRRLRPFDLVEPSILNVEQLKRRGRTTA